MPTISVTVLVIAQNNHYLLLVYLSLLLLIVRNSVFSYLYYIYFAGDVCVSPNLTSPYSSLPLQAILCLRKNVPGLPTTACITKGVEMIMADNSRMTSLHKEI